MTKADSPDFQQNEDKGPSSSERERRLANAVAGYLDVQCQGGETDIEGYCRLHPDLEPDLRIEIETLDQIEHLLETPAFSSQGDPDEDELPQSLSGYKILGEIGSGGMGRVLLATDLRLDRKVAIKTLKRQYLNNASLRARFMQEARTMARISHPNIVRIYSLGQPDEIPYFVMEFLEGTTVVEAAQALTLHQKVELMQKVVLAVEFMHQHQVIHRDLKPGNILVGPDLEPKVLDFGLALHVGKGDKRLSHADEIMGTLTTSPLSRLGVMLRLMREVTSSRWG